MLLEKIRKRVVPLALAAGVLCAGIGCGGISWPPKFSRELPPR